MWSCAARASPMFASSTAVERASRPAITRGDPRPCRNECPWPGRSLVGPGPSETGARLRAAARTSDILDLSELAQLRRRRVPHEQLKCRGAARRIEPRERGRCTTRTGDARKNNGTNKPDQHREEDDVSPAPSHLEPRQHPHCTHVTRPRRCCPSEVEHPPGCAGRSPTESGHASLERLTHVTTRWTGPQKAGVLAPRRR